MKFSRTHILQFLFVLTITAIYLFSRLLHLEQAMYFIYDQGRDIGKLVEITTGDLTMVGPTSGLAGFFLGPLWFYILLPGFLATGGSPVGVAAWAILLSATAVPGWCWLCWQLFWKHSNIKLSRMPDLLAGSLCLFGLLFLPASFISSNFIWNPLLGAPLMTGALIAFYLVRSAPEKFRTFWLSLGFLFLALTLQSEFAYAVFFLPPFFLLIPWMTQRKKLVDGVAAVCAIGITLLPQIAFELTNGFGMTRSLLSSLLDGSKSLPWLLHLQQRPLHLLDATVDFFDGPSPNGLFIRIAVALSLLISTVVVFFYSRRHNHLASNKQDKPLCYLHQLLLIFALIPYPFFLLWRGNEGNFFSYYLTSHFIFIIPLICVGIHVVLQKLWKMDTLGIVSGAILFSLISAPVFFLSTSHWVSTVLFPVNLAGYASMLESIKIVYLLQADSQSVTRVLTPNIHSQHYDYLFSWHGKKNDLQIPRTVPREDDTQQILVIERWGDQVSDYVHEERRRLTVGWKRQRVILSGTVTIEEWVKLQKENE